MSNRKGFDVASLGDAAARACAKKKASSNFFLGETFGGHWYGIFPPLVATFIGLLLEPVQARLGFQERHQKALLCALEVEMLDKHK